MVKVAPRLEDIKDGIVLEELNGKLLECFDDLCDPNKPPQAARKLSLSITLKPTGGGQFKIAYEFKTMLPPAQHQEVFFDIDEDAQGYMIREKQSRQLLLPALDSDQVLQEMNDGQYSE